MTDISGNLLWRFDHQRQAYESGHFWSAEQSSLDELSIEHLSTDSSLTEIYIQNGGVDTFLFVTSDGEYIQSIHDSLLSGELSREVDKSDGLTLQEETILTLNDFDDFYDTTNSLIANQEGLFVAQFMTNDAIGDWLIEEYPDTSGGQLEYLIPDEVCVAAAECSIIKCPIGGFSNPICDGCLSVVVICVIERIANEIF